MWTITAAQQPYPGKDQDRLMVQDIEQGHAVGVFDGHGRSDDCVEACARIFPKRMKCVKKEDAERGLRDSFAYVAGATASLIGGSTATVACLWDSGRVDASILGDSLIILRPSKARLIIGPLHNAGSNARERASAVSRGAVYRESYIHAPDDSWRAEVTRSFENQRRRAFIICEPEALSGSVAPGGWVALMSDGVINSLHRSFKLHLPDIVKLIDDGTEPSDLVPRYHRFQRDDSTLVVCRYKVDNVAVAVARRSSPAEADAVA